MINVRVVNIKFVCVGICNYEEGLCIKYCYFEKFFGLNYICG